jgi:hypothetical protein
VSQSETKAVSHGEEAPAAGLPRISAAFAAVAGAAMICAQGLAKPASVAAGTGLAATALTAGALATALSAAIALAIVRSRPSAAKVAGIAAVATGAVAGLAIAASSGAWVASMSALVLTGVGAGLSLPRLAASLPASIDETARARRGRAVVWGIVAALALLQTARLATFMADSSLRGAAVFPPNEEHVRHSCLSAYVNAAELARQGVANVYDAALTPEDPAAAHPAVELGIFHLDAYEYPPPFLLLPRLALALTHDFGALRAAWFALEALAFGGVVLLAARWVGGRAGARSGLLLPLVWLSFATLTTLQFQNFHVAMVALAMGAMLAFEEKRRALGGAMLAFAIVSKLSPGIFVVWLLVRRRFREVLWTLGFAAAFGALALLVLGTGPFQAFWTYHLPRLASGEAFPFVPAIPEINYSVYGLLFKLKALGAGGIGWGAASAAGWVYTAVVLGVAVVAARREGDRAATMAVWLALLGLAALRSPFAPDYAVPGTLWLLTILAAEVRTRRAIALFAVVWILASVLFPPPLSRTFRMIWALGGQLVTFGVLLWAALRRPRNGLTGSAA